MNIVWSWLLPDPEKSLAENVPLGLLWGELESLGWPWLSFLDPYGASWGALGGLGCPFWIPMAPIWSKGVVQEPPGLIKELNMAPIWSQDVVKEPPRRIKELKEPFQAFVGGQCVQTISFYKKICVFVIHDVADVCGPGSPVETPLPHAPGVRMTVVELTPSN